MIYILGIEVLWGHLSSLLTFPKNYAVEVGSEAGWENNIPNFLRKN